MQGTIFLKGMRFYGYHGALSAENENTGKFSKWM